jgi:hypothetical protein
MNRDESTKVGEVHPDIEVVFLVESHFEPEVELSTVLQQGELRDHFLDCKGVFSTHAIHVLLLFFSLSLFY